MTLSISVRKIYRKQALVSFFVSLFLAVFGMVYEHFSHGVYSPFMMFAFLIPLIFGTGIPLLLSRIVRKKRRRFSRISADLWFSGIAFLTIGSIMEGVLEIYGTTNHLIIVYPIAGAVLAAAAVVQTCQRGRVLWHTFEPVHFFSEHKKNGANHERL